MEGSVVQPALLLFGEPACLVDGTAQRIEGPARTIDVLLFLVLAREKPMERRRVAFALWPEAAEDDALANLRRHLHALTRTLPVLPDQRRWFEGSRFALRWTADDVLTDVTSFEAALAAGETERAVTLYGGPLCPAVDTEWADLARRRFARLVLENLDRLAERDRQSDPRRALAWAARALDIDPWRESCVRALIELHCRLGDTVAARRLYREFAQRLSQEFGTAPDPQTTAAYDAIASCSLESASADVPRSQPAQWARRAATSAVHGAAAAGNGRAAQVSRDVPVIEVWPENVHPLNASVGRPESSASRLSPPNNLPVQTSSFIGRRREVDELSALIVGSRLVTLVGAGGIGKTRTSLEVAGRVRDTWSHGVWFIELAPLARGEYLPTTIAQALNLSIARAADPVAGLLHALRAKHALLVVDNCEHLLEPAAALVDAILRGCPHVTVLASSRQALAVDGEQTYRLPSLEIPVAGGAEPLTADAALQSTAIELFVTRARAAADRFALTDENATAVADICRRLDGIPFAIELAAVRMKLLTPVQLSGRLDERFRLLTSGKRNALPRQQTLRALIDWSFELLDDRERIVFRRLSLFPNSFTLEAAHAVASDDDFDACDMLDVIGSLVDKSLILAEPAGEAIRFRMLESTRAYGREKLESARERDPCAARHLRFLKLGFAAAYERSLETCRSAELDIRLASELGDVRAALAYARVADPTAGASLLADIDYSWAMIGLDIEGLKHVDEFLEVLAADLHALRARLSCAAAQFAFNSQRLAKAFALSAEAVAQARAAADADILAAALRRFITSATHNGRLAQAQDAQLEAEALNPISRLHKLQLLASRAFVARHRGDLAAAADALGEARDQWSSVGHTYAELMVIVDLAEVEHARGATDEAIRLIRDAIDRLRCGKNRLALAQALCNLAAYSVAVDDVGGCIAAATEAIREVAGVDTEAPVVFVALEHLALARLLGGEIDLAATLSGHADAAFLEHFHETAYTERRTHERLMALLHERVTPDQLACLRAAGRALSIESAITSALI